MPKIVYVISLPLNRLRCTFQYFQPEEKRHPAVTISTPAADDHIPLKAGEAFVVLLRGAGDYAATVPTITSASAKMVLAHLNKCGIEDIEIRLAK